MDKNYPIISSNPTNAEIGAFLQTIQRQRQVDDVPSFTNLVNKFVSGRVTKRIPSGPTDVQSGDTLYDRVFALDGSKMYILVSNAGTNVWKQVSLSPAGSANAPITYSVKTASYTVDGLADHFVYGDTSSGPITFTLPSAATYDGYQYNFKNIGSSTSNLLTLQPVSGQTIDGSPRRTLLIYDATRLHAASGNWWTF